MVELWVSNKKVNAQPVYQVVTALSQAPKHPLVNVMLDSYAMEVQYLQDQLMEQLVISAQMVATVRLDHLSKSHVREVFTIQTLVVKLCSIASFVTQALSALDRQDLIQVVLVQLVGTVWLAQLWKNNILRSLATMLNPETQPRLSV